MILKYIGFWVWSAVCPSEGSAAGRAAAVLWGAGITGPPGEEPHRVGVPIADLTAGLWAALSINAALRHREVTGEGQHLDISLLDTQVSMLSIQGLNYLTSGEAPGLLGNAHPNIVPYQVFPTADGNIIVAVGNDDQFKRFCEFASVPELISDERFVTNKARVQNREALTQILNNVMRQKPSTYWLEALEKIKITCGPINTIDQVFADDQVVARDMRIEMEPVSYTHLRAHETREDRGGRGGVG